MTTKPRDPDSIDRLHSERTWTLRTGEILALRPVRKDDDSRQEAFVRGLSASTGYQRMMRGGFRIAPEWIEQMTDVDQRTHVALALTAVTDGVESFVGVGRYIVTTDSTSAEFALVVTDSRQHQGLGRRLLEALVARAEAEGLKKL